MKNDYTHIMIILDRTGSMESIRDDTIGGFNAFLHEQQAQPGQATLTLVQFDSQDPYEVVHELKPLPDIPDLDREHYVPRATTPLLDAMGRGINYLEQCLAAMPEDQQPARVVVVTITDGQENASREFRKEQVEKMIREKQEQLDWQFVFLSADLDAVGDALASGMDPDAVMAFDKTSEGTSAAWASTSSRISAYRASRAKKMEFLQRDRDRQAQERERKAPENPKPENLA